ncbi:YbjN domain-containing protein [Bifidobacterium amazonense]|uniref:YbjN domain-containing protein n=1 Tax=Bifidobacterium amazonense TaxID=2809027 RepID=A0ABS9VTK3_9BIFI|nr:YbjN domain-containing protein [Bifidobacterium amazonense]MCH9275422.1 YbjN domain-containing protein [Bifidobacterium amazonense]
MDIEDMTNDGAAALRALVEDALDLEGLDYTKNPDEGTIVYDIDLSLAVGSVNVVIWVESGRIGVGAVSSFACDPEDREAMLALAEYVCRVNAGSDLGGFQLGFDDGDVWYWDVLLTDGNNPSRELIQQTVFTPCLMWKRYGDGFLKVATGASTPEEVVAEAETSHTDDDER